VEENNTKEDGKVIEEEEDDDMAVNIDLDFGVNPTSGFSISSPQAPAAESSTDRNPGASSDHTFETAATVDAASSGAGSSIFPMILKLFVLK
jgi:hypothetical protein